MSKRATQQLTPTSAMAAIVAILLTAAWSLTCAPQLAMAPSAQLATVASVAPVQDGTSAGMQSAPPDDLVALQTAASTVAAPVNRPRHPRRAVPPDRKLPLSAVVQVTAELDVQATVPGTRATYEGPPEIDLIPPVESRAPPSGRAQLT